MQLPEISPAGEKVSLAIRPEYLMLGTDCGGIALGDATVAEIVFQGSFKRVLADSRVDPSIRFIAKVPAATALNPGDAVAVSCRAGDVILLAR
jgi:spermidine/putrescine transport system ATP-binding protein